MAISRIELVPQLGAEVRVVTLGLPGAPRELACDRGAVYSEAASDLRSWDAEIGQAFYLDSVIKGQVAVVCRQGSATLRVKVW